MHPARRRNQQTPPDTDESNSDNDMDIDSQHSILCTPQPLSAPQIYAPEFSPLEKYGYPPSLSGSSDDGSRDSMGGISEQNDGILFDNLHQDDDSAFYMEAPVHATTPASPKSPSCICRRLPLDYDNVDQNPRYKRQCTKAYSLGLTMNEVSPQMIVQMIVATKQLTQLATIPLLLDHGQRDLVDSKVWRLLQNSIAKPTPRSDPVINPINIIKDMGFPCVTHLFRLSRGEDSTTQLQFFLTLHLQV